MARKVPLVLRHYLELAANRSSDDFWDQLTHIANSVLDKHGSKLVLDGLRLQGIKLKGNHLYARKNFGDFSVTRSMTDEDGTTLYYQANCIYTLKSANFDTSHLKDIIFEHCNLASSSFFCTTLKHVHFYKLDLRNANFSGATLIGCRFHKCKLNNTSFENASFMSDGDIKSRFIKCDFGNNNFSGADISEVDGLSDIFSKKILNSFRPQLLGVKLPNSIIESVKTDAKSIISNWNQVVPKVAKEKTKEKYMVLLAAYTKLATHHASLTPKDLHHIVYFKSTNRQLAKFKNNHLLALKQINRQFIYLVMLQQIFKSIVTSRVPMDIVRIIFDFTKNNLPSKPFLNNKMIRTWKSHHPTEIDNVPDEEHLM